MTINIGSPKAPKKSASKKPPSTGRREPEKRHPIQSRGLRRDGAKLWQRITGRGMEVREGTLVKMRRFKLKGENGYNLIGAEPRFMSGAVDYFELYFAEAPDEIQGYVATTATINRVKKGERVAIQIDPESLWVRKIWPLDRKLSWYQF